jgi:hypothetical protein
VGSGGGTGQRTAAALVTSIPSPSSHAHPFLDCGVECKIRQSSNQIEVEILKQKSSIHVVANVCGITTIIEFFNVKSMT